MSVIQEYRELLRNRKFLHATAVLIGTMVGVGIFGIPLAFAKAGFLMGSFFLLLTGGVTILVMLIFSEVVLRTNDKHQLVGYASHYVGSLGQKIVFFSNTLGIYGALLAYMIVAGRFLANVLSYFFYFSVTTYSVAFAIVIALLLRLRIRTIEVVEFFMTSLFIVIILVIFLMGVGQIHFSNLVGINYEFWFLPYGVLLFAFSSLTSVPIQREILRGQEKNLSKSIILAGVIVGLLYLVFAFTVVGISGDITSPEALSGLFEFLGAKVIILGSLFGILSISTSALMLGAALEEVFHLDYKIPRWLSWLIVVVPVALLFLAGERNFIDVISLVGSVAIGIEPPIFLYAYLKAKKEGDRTPEYTINVPKLVLILISIMFIAGAAYAFLPSSL